MCALLYKFWVLVCVTLTVMGVGVRYFTNYESKSALIKQRTSHVKLPKIVILFDEQITFSKTLCKQAF